MRFLHWSIAPDDATPLQRKNFLNVQFDAVGMGLCNAASPFLPVFLTRLGATSFQVGLLTSMPAVTGFFFAIIAGRFLQSRRNIVPWFGAARLLGISAYALTGLVPFLASHHDMVQAVLLIWALQTIPQTIVTIAFQVVMNAVAGPRGRYELMSRRWSIVGFTTAVTLAVTGQVLDHLRFPINYQVVFVALSLGGLVSCYYSSHIELPDRQRHAPRETGLPLWQRLKYSVASVLGERKFTSFVTKRFVYTLGALLTTPLVPLYYVRVIRASDSWIGIISTVHTATLLVGYSLWSRQSRLRGPRFVLLWTVLGMSLYPALLAVTQQLKLLALYAAIAGVFQAGLDLVFFDELMRTVPPQSSATFVSFAASLQYLPTIIAPLLGTWLADRIGIPSALLIGTMLRLAGFALFARGQTGRMVVQS